MQEVVFTSILDPEMKIRVAAEMIRVLKPAGSIIWLDFRYNNLKNKHVKGIDKNEIETLFPNCEVFLKTVILAPPIARIVVPISWTIASIMNKFSFLRTHYLGIIRPKSNE